MKHNHHLRLPCLLLCLLFSLPLSACAGGGTPADTAAPTAGDTTPATVPDAVTDAPTEAPTAEPTEAPTEAETDPAPAYTAEPPVINGSFAVRPLYREAITTVTEKKSAVLKTGETVTVDYTSTFFGSESAVDHDTMHFGDIYRTELVNRQMPERLRAGDLDGDRVDELCTFADRTLTVWQISPYTQKELFCAMTVTFGFDASLAGLADFDGDGFTDICLYAADGHVLLGLWDGSTFALTDCGPLPGTEVLSRTDTLYVGYVNKDTRPDLICADGKTLTTWVFDGKAFAGLNIFTLLDCNDYTVCGVSDINSDGLTDFGVVYHKEKSRDKIVTFFGRGDGSFGPNCESEIGNRNLYPVSEYGTARTALSLAGGDVTGDGVQDWLTVIEDAREGTTRLYCMAYPSEAPAYDYSTHIIRLDDGSYILYTGTLYSDYNTDKYNVVAGDHIIAYTSPDGQGWYPMTDGCCFLLGSETGERGQWYSGNTMEPEVLYIDGVYYMYFQCEGYAEKPDGTKTGHDQIGVATSTDGLHFTRRDTPVIETDDPYACFHHQEVIYVPDDPEGCFWMYVANSSDTLGGVFLLKSDDPFRFELKTDGVKRRVSGFSTGNQAGYINDVGGARLFVNIISVYDPNVGQGTTALVEVPGLSFSRDGIHWTDSDVYFACTDTTDPRTAGRKNMVFLGMSTLNGTGELPQNEDGSISLIYAGCCTDRGMAPQIFYASEGYGIATLTLTVE